MVIELPIKQTIIPRVPVVSDFALLPIPIPTNLPDISGEKAIPASTYVAIMGNPKRDSIRPRNSPHNSSKSAFFLFILKNFYFTGTISRMNM